MTERFEETPENPGAVETPAIDVEAAMTPPVRTGGQGLLSNAAWNMMAYIVMGIVGFVTVGIVVRQIGAESYGLYLTLAMIGGFVVLLDLGLGEATLKYVAQYHARDDIEGVNRVVGATLAVYLLVGLVGGGVIIGCASWIVQIFKMDPGEYARAARLFMIAGLSFILVPVVGAFRTIPQAVHRYDVFSKAQVVMELLRGGMIIAVVLLGYGLLGLVVWMVANQALNLVVMMVIAVRLVPGLHPWPRPTRRGLREVFGYGVFSFVNQILGTLIVYVDRFILGMFFGMAEVAYLGVPKQMLLRAQGVYISAGSPLFPKFSAMKEGSGMRHLFLFSTWCMQCLSLALFVPTVIILPEFMRLWQGAEFASHSAPVAMVIAAAAAVQGATLPYYGLLKGTARIHWLTVIYIVTAVVGIMASVVLVSIFGVMGGGYRVWATVVIGLAMVLIVCRKIFPTVRLRSFAMTHLVVPMVVAALCGGAFWWVWSVLALHGWVWTILGWLAMALLLAAGLCGSSRLLTGPEGDAAQLLASVRARFPRRADLGDGHE